VGILNEVECIWPTILIKRVFFIVMVMVILCYRSR